MDSSLMKVVATELAPGEQIEATLPRATSGASPWLPAAAGLLGELASRRKIYAVVVTNQRLLLLLHSRALKARWSLEGSCPRSAARIAEFKPGVVFAKLVLELPGPSGEGRQTLRLSVHMYQRKDARLVVSALSSG